MKHLKKLVEQEHAAEIACQNLDFLVHSSDHPGERDGLLEVRNGLRKIRDVYRARIHLQSRQEQLQILSIRDYQNAKAR